MKELPSQFFNYVAARENSVLLETSLVDSSNHLSILFSAPKEILELHKLSELDNFLLEIESFLKKGFFVAGFFSYECGYFVENSRVASDAPVEPSTSAPLAWFGVYTRPIVYDHHEGKIDFPDPATRQDFENAPPITSGFHIDDLHFNLNMAEYTEKISRIKEYIEAGDTYQINFTGHYRFNFAGSPLALYRELKKKQEVSYGAYIQTANQTFLSFSPELFFRIGSNRIITRPMKGTVARGKTELEDQENARWLQNDAKNRAENVMIVDLLRNDLGRLCETGSVKVSELFKIEKYKTLFQMTSQVNGTLRKDLTVREIFYSLFPSGSITGAPKIRAMQIIKELETGPRGIYTGSIGYFAPTTAIETAPNKSGIPEQTNLWSENSAQFNVAIRTIRLSGPEGEMGVGSGIVYDSTAEDEFNECAVKGRFLTELEANFSLLEAVLWEKKFIRLDKHLTRLARTAAYFGFSHDLETIRLLLHDVEKTLQAAKKYKVRLQLEKSGSLHLEASEVVDPVSNAVAKIKLSDTKVDSHNPFLYHKTTNRQFYDISFKEAANSGFADVIFLNERQEVTEGAISNLVIEKDGKLFTPPLQSGLLNGMYREYLLEEKIVTEKVLFQADLESADKIYICNSIRGLREVKLADSDR